MLLSISMQCHYIIQSSTSHVMYVLESVRGHPRLLVTCFFVQDCRLATCIHSDGPKYFQLRRSSRYAKSVCLFIRHTTLIYLQGGYEGCQKILEGSRRFQKVLEGSRRFLKVQEVSSRCLRMSKQLYLQIEQSELPCFSICGFVRAFYNAEGLKTEAEARVLSKAPTRSKYIRVLSNYKPYK